MEWGGTGPTGKGIALVGISAILIGAVYLIVFGLSQSGSVDDRIGEAMGRTLFLLLLLAFGISWVYWFAHVRKKERIDDIERKVLITPDHIQIPSRWGRTRTINKIDVQSIRTRLEMSLTILELRTLGSKYDLPWTVAVELVTDGYSIEDPEELLGHIEPLETDPDVFSAAEID